MEPRDTHTATEDLPLAKLLAEPIMRLMMCADGVTPEEVVGLLNSARLRGRQTSQRRARPLDDRQSQAMLRTPFSFRETRLTKAIEAVRQAKHALRQAEQRFDRDRSRDSGNFMQEIRRAETELRAARATLQDIDPQHHY